MPGFWGDFFKIIFWVIQLYFLAKQQKAIKVRDWNFVYTLNLQMENTEKKTFDACHVRISKCLLIFGMINSVIPLLVCKSHRRLGYGV